MSATFSNPEESLAAIVLIRNAAEQRAFVTNTPGAPTQAFIESISAKIRELLPRDPDLAQTLAETNLYIASLLNTPLAWASANRSQAQVLYTMRKSVEAQQYFEKAVQLSPQKASLRCELGQVYQQEKMTAKARSEFERCTALRTESRPAEVNQIH